MQQAIVLPGEHGNRDRRRKHDLDAPVGAGVDRVIGGQAPYLVLSAGWVAELGDVGLAPEHEGLLIDRLV